jgi:cysteine desulfuration protein SufE
MTLAEKQEEMIRRINEVGDYFDQYNYLVVKAQSLPEMSPEKKKDENLLSGCQSLLWLSVKAEDGRLHMEADSDTLILRGVLELLRELFDGEKIEEIQALPVRLFEETELAATFTSDRNTGIKTIIQKLKE